MPLSEHEQRLLDQIERALYAEDPKFATTVRSTDLRTHMRRRLRRAAFVLVVGVVLLVLGLSTSPAVGIAGFAVMVIALLLGLSALKRHGGSSTTLRTVGGNASRPTRGASSRSKPAKPSKGQGSVRERLEQRWNRRWDERGRS
ncbi:MAG: DUF3040 domain-containing protein [Pseudorhodobacter sp.]|nr:DUF3040 domain-containing protein [Frankiaceae bacterium]